MRIRTAGIRLLAILVGISLFAGCPAGFDVSALQTPPGVVRELNAFDSEIVSQFSVGLERAVDDQGDLPCEIEYVRRDCERLHAQLSGEAPAFKSALEQSKSGSSVDDRIKVIETFRRTLSASGSDSLFVDDARGVRFIKSFQTLMLLEVWRLKEALLADVQRDAGAILKDLIDLRAATRAKSNVMKSITDLEAVLNTVKNNNAMTQLSSTWARNVRMSMETTRNVIATLGKTKSGRKDAAEFARVITRLKNHALLPMINRFTVVENALTALSVQNNPHLQNVGEPLAMGASCASHGDVAAMHLEQNLNEQSPLLVTMPDEREMTFMAEYLMLRKRNVAIIKLGPLAEAARNFELNIDQFIEWISIIVNRFDDNMVVFLDGISALNFDAGDSAWHHAQAAEHLARILEACARKRLVVPVARAHGAILAHESLTRARRIALKPYDLVFTRKIVQNVANTFQQKIDVDALMLVAKIARGLKPQEFFITTISDLHESLKRQPLLAKDGIAAAIAEGGARFGGSVIADSGVLKFSPAKVEEFLQKNAIAFSRSSSKEELLQAIANGQSQQRELSDLLVKVGDSSRAGNRLVKKLRSKIKSVDKAAKKLVKEAKGACRSKLREHKKSLDKIGKKHQDDLDATLRKKLAKAATRIDSYIAVERTRFARSTEKQTKRSVNHMREEAKQARSKVKNAADEATAEMTRRAQERTREFSDKIDEFKRNLDDLLIRRRDGLAQDLHDLQERSAKFINEYGDNIDKNVQRKIDEAERRIADALRHADNTLRRKVDDLDREVDDIVLRGAKNASDEVRRQKKELERLVREHGKIVDEDAQRTVSDMRKRLSSILDSMQDECDEKVAGVRKDVDGMCKKGRDDLDDDMRNHEARMDDLKKEQEKAAKDFEEKIAILRDVIEQGVKEKAEFETKLREAMAAAKETIASMNDHNKTAEEKKQEFEKLMEGFATLKEWRQKLDESFKSQADDLEDIRKGAQKAENEASAQELKDKFAKVKAKLAAHKDSVEVLRQEFDGLDGRVKKQKRDAQQYAQAFSDLRNEFVDEKIKNRDTEKRCDDLDRDFGESKRFAENLSSRFDDLGRESEARRRDAESLGKQVKSLQQEWKANKRNTARIAEDVEELRSDLSAARRAAVSREEMDDLRAELKEGESNFASRLDDFVDGFDSAQNQYKLFSTTAMSMITDANINIATAEARLVEMAKVIREIVRAPSFALGGKTLSSVFDSDAIKGLDAKIKAIFTTNP